MLYVELFVNCVKLGLDYCLRVIGYVCGVAFGLALAALSIFVMLIIGIIFYNIINKLFNIIFKKGVKRR